MIANIQILRAVAAIMVVFHHGVSATWQSGTPALSLERLQAIGQSGVDLFFVISGFVMVLSTHNTSKSAGQFLIGRARRIVPIYWILTLAMAAMLILVGRMAPSSGGLGHLATSLTFTSQLMMQSYPVLFLGWTLEFEVLFYLLFALGLAMPLRNGSVIVPTIVIIGLSLVLPVTIALEFIAGMLVARAYLARPVRRWPAALVLVGGIALLAMSVYWPQPPLSYRALIWGVPATLIVFGAVNTAQFHTRTLAFLGDASYSIYLIQAFTVALAFKFMQIALPGTAPEIQILLSTLATTASGALLYVVLERPLLTAMRHR